MRRLWIFFIACIFIGAAVASAYIIKYDKNSEQDDLLQQFRPILKKHPMILKKEDFTHLSPWQKFVTPNDPAIMEIAKEIDTCEDAFSEAVSWIWVSDDILNGKDEKWLMPNEFIVATPSYPTNPIKGSIVSDCEEQAYSLVSLLRSLGVPASDVRVVVGLVDVGEEQGGHAWVEIRYNEKWLSLEATSGSYWDSDNGKKISRKGASFNYYAKRKYPSVEVWGYFNDIFYHNPQTGEGNAPGTW